MIISSAGAALPLGSRWQRPSLGNRARGHAPRLAHLRIRARKDPEDDVNEKSGGFLGGLLGTGTQRIKAGEEGGKAGNPPKKKKLSPTTGTKQLKPSQRKSGGLFQGRGSQSKSSQKDPNTVFVAGATGRVGLRIVRELLLAGFKVRAGARNTDKAQGYAKLAEEFGIVSSDAVKRLQIVPVDLEETETIISAIGNAGKIVQAIGAAENNVLDFGAPKRIDGTAAINLIDAAVQVQADQYVMVSSLGTGKFGWPAGALNLFGGILFQKRRAEKALEDSGLPFVIVRPGGMERPTDDYKLTNNVRLSTKDTLFGGQVSRYQVAELISTALSNPGLAENKILEVVAEEEAPLVDYQTLLEQHPTEISQEERTRQRQLQSESKERIATAQAEVDDAKAAFSEADSLVKQLKDALKEKRSSIAAAEKDLAPVIDEADQLAAEISRLRSEAEETSRRQEAAKAVLNAARIAKREGRTLSEEEISSIEAPILKTEEAPTEAPAKAKRGRRSSPAKKTEEGIAEGIAQKEIAIKLGNDVPEASTEEKGIAEGIAKKEIAIDTGKDEGTKSWFNFGKPKPSSKSSSKKASGAASQVEEEAPKDEAAAIEPPKVETKARKAPISEEELDEMRSNRNKSALARADKEASFLAALETSQKEALQKKVAAAEKRAEDARKKAAEETRARLLKVSDEEESSAAEPVRKTKSRPAPTKRAAIERESPKPAVSKVAPKKAPLKKEEPAPAPAEAPDGNKDELKMKAGKPSASSSNGSKPEPVASSETKSPATGNGSQGGAESQKLPNAVEARDWIQEWRSRDLSKEGSKNSK